MTLTKEEAVDLIEEIGLRVMFLGLPEDPTDVEAIRFVVIGADRPMSWVGVTQVETNCNAIRGT